MIEPPMRFSLRSLSLAVWLLVLAGLCAAQSRWWGWTDHLSYSCGVALYPGQEGITLQTPATLLRYNCAAGSVECLSCVGGLSGSSIAASCYDPQADLQVVAYTDGVLDFLVGRRLTTLRTLAEDLATGAMDSLLSVAVWGDRVYVLSRTRVVEIDPSIPQVLGSYRVWNPATDAECKLYTFVVRNGGMLLATDDGIYRAKLPLKSPTEFAPFLLQGHQVLDFAYDTMGHMLAYTSNGVDSSLRVGTLLDTWDVLPNSRLGRFYSLMSGGGKFYYTNGERVCSVEHGGAVSILWDDASQPVDKKLEPAAMLLDSELQLYLASRKKGLVMLVGGEAKALYASTPQFSTAYRVAPLGERGFVVTAGGYSRDGKPLNRPFQFYLESGNQHTAVYASDAHDAGAVAVLDADGMRYLVATSDAGVFEYQGEKRIAVHNALSGAIPSLPNGNVSPVVDLLVTPRGEWWMVTGENSNRLVYRSAQGEWRNFPLPGGMSGKASRMTLTPGGQIWVASPSVEMLMAIDPSAYVASSGVQGYSLLRVLAPPLNSLATPTQVGVDTQGNLWAATSHWLLSTGDYTSLLPKPGGVPSSVGSKIFNATWGEEEALSCLFVDPGDQVWCASWAGTLYHTDPLEKSIVRMRYDNSPLPKAAIHDLAFRPTDGTLFIATEAGLLAYRSGALPPAESYNDVRIYPNPVRPEFQGRVTIDGLLSRTTVKITDAAGRLVRHLTSDGGRCEWDLRNDRGNEVTTGVYLVFCVDSRGNHTQVAKVAVVR